MYSLASSSTMSAISFRKRPAVAKPATAIGAMPDRPPGPISPPKKPCRLMSEAIPSIRWIPK